VSESPQHPSLRQLRAEYLRDRRRVRRLVRLPPEQLAEVLIAERTARYHYEREQFERRIAAARRGSAAAVSDAQLLDWIQEFQRRRPREFGRLTMAGLAIRLQGTHAALQIYSSDWLRQRIAALQEALPPSTAAGAGAQDQSAARSSPAGRCPA